MNKNRHPFALKQAEKTKIYQYLGKESVKKQKFYLNLFIACLKGSDGFPVSETYNLYLKNSDEFKAKARKYANNNLLLKNSILHNTKSGYNNSEKLKEEVFLEREKQLKLYEKNFHISSFDEDQNLMYECYTGKSKRIRIIRELNKKKTEEFSEDFNNKQVSWLTRYCILSRFIQGARYIIVLIRLEKVLAILRTLTPEIIQKIEKETVREKENDITSEELKSKE